MTCTGDHDDEVAPDGYDSAAMAALRQRLAAWATELGFADLGVCSADPGRHAWYLRRWLARGFHGEMDYMARSVPLRSRPATLDPAFASGRPLRVISVRMRYLDDAEQARQTLARPGTGYVARYALGRDYHKLIRRRLARLADRLQTVARDLVTAGRVPPARAFVDSAPLLEKAYAEAAGLGWIGKNTLLLTRREGSWFFLGEVLTDLPLPLDRRPERDLCGQCTACLDVCPTRAFVGPRQLDASRCISYLTIEHRGVIPEPLRGPIGNRVFGCDDCQLVCPWNAHARPASEPDFLPRAGLDAPALLDLFGWSAATFERNSRGSPLRRLGYGQWLRNIAVALGNAPADARVAAALQCRLADPETPEPAPEHIRWALRRQQAGLQRRADGPGADRMRRR